MSYEYVPLQIRYGNNPRTERIDGWRVLTISILLNRTSRVQVERVLPRFFGVFPIALLAENADIPWLHEVMESIVAPLGFAHTKTQRITAMSKEWLDHEDWRSAKNVWRFTGCGAYAVDAYRLFVEGDHFTPLISTDHVLARWKRHMALERARSAI